MDKVQDKDSKCYCARCFLHIDADDKVDIEGLNYHKICSMCCICRQVPRSLKTFYGHVFCRECFQRHVLKKFRGGDTPSAPSAQCSRCWMQWAPAPAPAPASAHAPVCRAVPGSLHKEKNKAEGTASKINGSKTSKSWNSDKAKGNPPRKCFCARCLQSIDGAGPLPGRVEIEGQSFHEKCAQCYCCHRVPTSSPKIYNGKLFCAACYRLLMNVNRKAKNPEEFYRECCEQWNPQVAHVKQLMAGNNGARPVASPRGGGSGASESAGARGGGGWPTDDALNKCDARSPAPAGLHTTLLAPVAPPPPPGGATSLFRAATVAGHSGTLAATHHTDIGTVGHDWAIDGSAIDEILAMSEKIEKLAKLLQQNSSQSKKKWKNFDMEDFQDPMSYGWVDIQERVKNNIKMNLHRPKCLWQCGVLNYYYVNNECDIGVMSNQLLSKCVMCNVLE